MWYLLQSIYWQDKALIFKQLLSWVKKKACEKMKENGMNVVEYLLEDGNKTILRKNGNMYVLWL